MARTRKWGRLGAMVLVGGIGGAWIVNPTFSASGVSEGSQPVIAAWSSEVNECFADEWVPTEDAVSGFSVAAKPCRPCQDRPWCECTIPGAHRVSCNPCCYQNYAGDIICFD